MVSVCNFMIGDVSYLGLENSVLLHVISRVLRGISVTGVFVPTIFEL